MTLRQWNTVVTSAVALIGSYCVPAVAAPIQLPGGIDFIPAVILEYQYDDNVTRAAVDQTASRVIASRSEFVFEAHHNADSYRLNYAVDHGEYLDSEADSYTDQELSFDSKWEFNSYQRAELHASVGDAHEGRGSGFSLGIGDQLDEPDQYVARDVNALLGYGPESSRLRFELLVGADSRDYEGRETRARDRGSYYGRLSAFFALGGKSELVTEAVHKEINYVSPEAGAAPLDSRETDYLLGINWESAKTSCRLRGGSREKEFDDPARHRFSGPRWLVALQWMPLSYSQLDLATERKTDEMQGSGDFIDVTTHSFNWQHNWSERVSSSLSYAVDQRQVEGRGDVQRNEDRERGNVALSYQMRRWLSLSAGVQVQQQDSIIKELNYDRNISYLGFTVSL